MHSQHNFCKCSLQMQNCRIKEIAYYCHVPTTVKLSVSDVWWNWLTHNSKDREAFSNQSLDDLTFNLEYTSYPQLMSHITSRFMLSSLTPRKTKSARKSTSFAVNRTKEGSSPRWSNPRKRASLHFRPPYRAWLKGGPQDWWILILLLLTTSPLLCLQHSRNLGTTCNVTKK